MYFFSFSILGDLKKISEEYIFFLRILLNLLSSLINLNKI